MNVYFSALICKCIKKDGIHRDPAFPRIFKSIAGGLETEKENMMQKSQILAAIEKDNIKEGDLITVTVTCEKNGWVRDTWLVFSSVTFIGDHIFIVGHEIDINRCMKNKCIVAEEEANAIEEAKKKRMKRIEDWEIYAIYPALILGPFG